MSFPSPSGQLGQTVSRFVQAERGNIAMIFAIALVPIMGFIGAAVDYSRTNAARSAMQAALDSTALMLSKDAAATTLTAEQITARAQAYFNALYTGGDSTWQPVTATYTNDSTTGSTIKVEGAGTVDTKFMKVAGYPQLNFKVSSTATWGSTRMRVAMALDVTGSMNDDGKMAAMQTAAKDLVDKLAATAKSTDDLYISIVPFAQMVNVGASNVNASWIKWDDWDATNRQRVCNNGNCNWVTNSHSTWKGCVTDRDQPADTTNAAPTTAATRYPAVQYEQFNQNICPAQILPMTTAYGNNSAGKANTQVIKDKITSLVPNGGTNQPIGMAWAWTTLQSGDPMNTPAKDSNYKYTDAIILLSDGLNTIDRWYGDGRNPSSEVDARQKLLCDNIKAPVAGKPDTVIYTIQVNTDGDAESAVLKYCASSGNFFPTSTTAGIALAFNQIGQSLSKLRIAK